MHLAIEGLTVRYGGVVAVDELSLELAPGEVVGLIGPNGAGKTSLMDAVSGFTPYTGRVGLDGQRIDGWAPHRRAAAGLVRSFQGLELFAEMSVLENLQVPHDRHGGWGTAVELVKPLRTILPPVTLAAVQEFGLQPMLDRLPDEISYGQRRLVAIARAVAAEPSVLLLDEPVSGPQRPRVGGVRAPRAAARRRVGNGGARDRARHELRDEHLRPRSRDRLRQIRCAGTPAEVRSDPRAIAAYLGEEVREEARAEPEAAPR